jgi:hypothetical protein
MIATKIEHENLRSVTEQVCLRYCASCAALLTTMTPWSGRQSEDASLRRNPMELKI